MTAEDIVGTVVLLAIPVVLFGLWGLAVRQRVANDPDGRVLSRLSWRERARLARLARSESYISDPKESAMAGRSARYRVRNRRDLVSHAQIASLLTLAGLVGAVRLGKEAVLANVAITSVTVIAHLWWRGQVRRYLRTAALNNWSLRASPEISDGATLKAPPHKRSRRR